MLTADTLRAATGCTAEHAALFAGPIAEACAAYKIDTPARLAAFLAQVGHESGSLRYVRELASGAAYEGRKDLGNTKPGDGIRYRGRGLLQTTGRANYRRVAYRIPNSPDFEAEPELLELPRWAAMSAADYWADHELNTLADAGQFELITRRINGGLNGQADRLQRWERAKAALAAAPSSVTDSPPTTAAAAVLPPPKESTMPLPAILAALLPSLIESVPKLGKLFGSGSEVAERNVKAAEIAMQIAQTTLGSRNAQEAVETLKADPQAVQQVVQAIESRWLELTEAGGDGIAGARKADETTRQSGDMLHSPSFWVTLALLPLVYLVVGSVVGLWGESWPSDVRAAIATAVVSLIIGGAAGYYWGQTTSRNRSAAA